MTAREEFDALATIQRQLGNDLVVPLSARMNDLLDILYPGDTQTLTGPAGLVFGLKRVQ